MENYKEMNFLFSGIGIDYRLLIHNSDIYHDELLLNYMKRAYDFFNIDLQAYFDGKQVENPIIHNWIGNYTLDCVIYEKYRGLHIKPKYFLGYSMGLITALQCGKAISYEDGINILIEIRKNHILKGQESMSAVVGLNYDTVMELIHKNSLSGKIFIASENNMTCFIISGVKDALLHFNDLALKEGAYIGKVDSDYAFHTDFLQDCSDGLNKIVRYLVIHKLEYPLVSAYDQRLIIKQEDIRKELVINLYKKMYWDKSILRAVEGSVQSNNEFIEVSLGKSLTVSSQKINDNNTFHTYDSFFNQSILIS